MSQSEERRRSREHGQQRAVYHNVGQNVNVHGQSNHLGVCDDFERETRQRGPSGSRSKSRSKGQTIVALKKESRSRGRSRDRRSDSERAKEEENKGRKVTNQFSSQLDQIAGANNVMMDDIIDEIDGRFGSPKYWAKQLAMQQQIEHLSPRTATSGKYTRTTDTECDGSASASETDDGDSDDSLMSKPRQHKYSTTHGTHFHDEDEKLVRPPTAERQIRGSANGNGKESYPYNKITNRQFVKLQNAITNAKTQSDFEKLELIIKNGQIPELDWHGKGDAYNLVKRMQSGQSMTMSGGGNGGSRPVGLGMGG